MIFCVEVYKN